MLAGQVTATTPLYRLGAVDQRRDGRRLTRALLALPLRHRHAHYHRFQWTDDHRRRHLAHGLPKVGDPDMQEPARLLTPVRYCSSATPLQEGASS